MRLRGLHAVLGLLLLASAPAFGQPAGQAPAAAGTTRPRGLLIKNEPWTGDFDAMLARRMIRVLVPYSRTLYFIDRGHERGLTGELVRDFERYINRKYKTGNRPLTVYIVPTTRDQLLPGLVQGLGDIAAGNLTITEGRLAQVDLVPLHAGASEIVATGPKSPPIATVDDLSGKTVHVRPATSYYESLVALNERFAKQGTPPVKLVALPDALEDEDKLEMLNAGLFEVVIVDDWKGKMWAQVLPEIRLHPEVSVRQDVKTGWAIRKGSPQLAEVIADFGASYVKKEGVSSYRLKQYMKRIKQVRDPTASEEWKRFEETLALFDKYGDRYGFDPLMLAAQGYQESHLDQRKRSRVGAIGVMQLMPKTGAEMKVGDVRVTEANIHAGAKYMDHLMAKYFKDAQFNENNRTLFAFASYNAGPARIAKMRAEASKRGLDPNKWFNNVEQVTAEKVGIEPVTYVRNIYKYYVAYKLIRDAAAATDKARAETKAGAQ